MFHLVLKKDEEAEKEDLVPWEPQDIHYGDGKWLL